MLAHADSKAAEVALKWQGGDWSANDVRKVLDELGISSPSPAIDPTPAPAMAPPVPSAALSLTLGQLVGAFWKERCSAWKPRTVTEYLTCKSRILSEMGEDLPVASIDYYKAKAFRDKLLKSGLSPARVNLYTGFLKALLAFEMQTTRILPANPCERLQYKDTRRKDELRAAFDPDDLRMMFVDSDAYGQDQIKAPERFWVPLIALYTGARMEEICQLHDDQIAEVDGHWCMVVEAKHPDQSVKTSEKRLIPLHPFLLDLGLHRFAQKRTGSGHLWPTLPRLNNRYGHYFGRWFKEFKDKCGIDPKPSFKVFHSFRHTVETKLQYEEADQRLIDQMMGHSVAAESARYGKQFVNKLHDNVVLKLNWREEIGLDHLLKSKWAAAHLG